MTNDFPQQFASKEQGVAIEKSIGQRDWHLLEGQWMAEKVANHSKGCLIRAEHSVFTVDFDHPPATAVREAARQL